MFRLGETSLTSGGIWLLTLFPGIEEQNVVQQHQPQAAPQQQQPQAAPQQPQQVVPQQHAAPQQAEVPPQQVQEPHVAPQQQQEAAPQQVQEPHVAPQQQQEAAAQQQAQGAAAVHWLAAEQDALTWHGLTSNRPCYLFVMYVDRALLFTYVIRWNSVVYL